MAPATFYLKNLKKNSTSISNDLREAQLHKQSSQVFRGFRNINKGACRYIIFAVAAMAAEGKCV